MTNPLADLEPQKVSARAELSVSHLDGRTRISRLYQEGAAKIRLPRVADDPLEAVLINTAGGLTGGDRLRLVDRCRSKGVGDGHHAGL